MFTFHFACENANTATLFPLRTKPIFLMLHDAFTKLYYVQKEYRSDWMQRLREVLQKYPQVIVLSGHIHLALQCPNVIFQEGFTAVQVPCLGEIGYIGGDELFE